jgi:hypothetical protein
MRENDGRKLDRATLAQMRLYGCHKRTRGTPMITEIGDDMAHRTAGVIPINDYRPQEAQHGS